MYHHPSFKEDDKELVLAFMQQHPFIFLSGVDQENKPVATQVPVLTEQRNDRLILKGHLMKETDHCRAFEQNPQVLAVFTAQHCYVSASWYENPNQGSTWNYMSVHVKGNIRFLLPEEMEVQMQEYSLFFENHKTDSATVYQNLPSGYREKQLAAISCFEIEATGIEHVFKLSQNRDEESFESILTHLRNGDEGSKAIACEMEKRKSKLFGR